MSKLLKAVCECKNMKEDDLIIVEQEEFFEVIKGIKWWAWIIHLTLMLVTGFFWVAVMFGWYFFKERKYQCMQCERYLEKSNIRGGV